MADLFQDPLQSGLILHPALLFVSIPRVATSVQRHFGSVKHPKDFCDGLLVSSLVIDFILGCRKQA
jgi:hypothetical protein